MIRFLRHPASVLTIVLVVGYGGTLTTYFNNDDFIWIRDTLVASPLGLPGALWAPTVLGEFFFRPLVNLTFAADGLLWHLWAPGYHLTNIALHGLASWFLYQLVVRILDDRRLALAAALIFLLRPTHANAVTWLSGRTELLSTAAVIAALTLHSSARVAGAAGAALCFAVGLLSKENAVVFVPLAIGTDLVRGVRLEGRRYLIYIALLVAYVGVRSQTVQHLGAGVIYFEPTLRFDRLGLIHFLWGKANALGTLLFRPLALAAPLSGVALMTSFVAWVAMLARRTTRTRFRGACLAGLLTFLPLLPHTGFWVTQARYAYLPSTGVSLAAALLFDRAGVGLSRLAGSGWRPAVLWAGTLVLALLSAADLRRENLLLYNTGQIAKRLLDETGRLISSPPPGSVIHYFRLGLLRRGDPPHVPPFTFGLEAAVQLTLGDRSLAVDVSEDPALLQQPLPLPGRRYGLRVTGGDGSLAEQGDGTPPR